MFTIIWDCFIAAPLITVKVTSNLNTPLMVGQTDNILTCDVSGADNLNPTIAYLWTKDDGHTQTQVGTNSNLTLSSLRFSHIGDYTCNVTINSTLLNNNISISSNNSQRVIIQSELNYLTIIIVGDFISLSNSPGSTICHRHKQRWWHCSQWIRCYSDLLCANESKYSFI